MSVRSHVYSSCFERHAADSAAPLPGKWLSARRPTECTSKIVPYASNTSADISNAMEPPEGDANIGASPTVPEPSPMLMRFVAFVAAAAVTCVALAQSWPGRPVKMVVPFPAGGPTDVVMRALSEEISSGPGL